MDEVKKITDWTFGEFTPIVSGQLVPLPDWSQYLPVVEYQNNYCYDRSNCSGFAVTNQIETLEYRLTHQQVNYSDRDLGARAGTTLKNGNYISKVFDTAREYLVLERDWPDTPNKDEYYITKNDLPKIKLELYREWVPTYNKKKIIEALLCSPLVVQCEYANGPGILNPSGNKGHIVMLFKAEECKYWEIFDHYTNSRKKYAWDYEFGAIMKATLIIDKVKTLMKNNTLVQLVQGQGGFGLFLDDKIIVDDTAKVLASWLVRNNGKTEGMVKALTLEDWNKFDKIDLKGNNID